MLLVVEHGDDPPDVPLRLVAGEEQAIVRGADRLRVRRARPAGHDAVEELVVVDVFNWSFGTRIRLSRSMPERNRL